MAVLEQWPVWAPCIVSSDRFLPPHSISTTPSAHPPARSTQDHPEGGLSSGESTRPSATSK